MTSVISWITANWVEIAAAVVSITYVILGIRQIIWLWLFGLISAALYAWVYGHAGFYAGMTLQAYYAGVSIYGWFHWRSRQASGSGGKASLPVTRAGGRLLLVLAGCWILLWLLAGFLLDNLTDSTIPWFDAFTAAGGVVATWMLARKLLEQWIFWIIVDVVSIGLYLWQGLYATTVLFSVYVVMAVIGYTQWRKSWRESR